ncbi:MAG: ATP-binding protein [Gemmatimonadaceae bacterium]
MPDPLLPGAPSSPQVRPLVWRLPLVVLVVVSLAGLVQLDRVLRREYRAGAIAQAAQADALLESALQQRLAAVHNLAVLVAGTRRVDDAVARFAVVAPEVRSTVPDAARLYLLDAKGAVRAVDPPSPSASAPRGTPTATLPPDSRSPAEQAALQRARETHLAAVGGADSLSGGNGPGVLVVDPVLRGDRVAGFVAAVLPYQRTLGGALAASLDGPFAYRILDDAGRLIGSGGEYPASTGHVERREVTLPGGRHWTLVVGVPRFQPVAPRILTWAVGLLLILLVIFLVLREENRAERFAQHSLNLELLSRDLLDANLRLEERAQQVAEANRAKSRFLANVSHELRTPLNAIVGYNGLTLEGLYGDVTPPLRQAHERIRTAAEHLLGVVDDVLDLSKIEVGRMHVDEQTTDVAALLDSVVTVVEPIATAKGVRVDVVVGRDVPRIVTDPRHVRQILLNLASNAIKFTERGSVSLVARRAAAPGGDGVSITVHDTGIGIAERDLERIFEEFEQVRPSARGDSLQRGTGLGLAIARKLARLLGGDVSATSRPGEGSHFTLTLPAEPPRTGMQTPPLAHERYGSPHEPPADSPADDSRVGELRPRADVGVRIPHSAEPEPRT